MVCNIVLCCRFARCFVTIVLCIVLKLVSISCSITVSWCLLMVVVYLVLYPSSCRCGVFVSCVHAVAFLNAVLCVV